MVYGLSTATDLAAEALRLCEVDPARARRTANDAIAAALPAERSQIASRAERAFGIAAREEGRLDDAGRHLRRAVADAKSAGSSELMGEARVSLASVVAFGGDHAGALRQLDRAARELPSTRSAEIHLGRALVLQMGWRLSEAVDEYRVAIPRLRGEPLLHARALLNRSVLCAYRGETRSALADLTKARAIADGIGQTGLAAKAAHNMAWVTMLTGDIPGALAAHDEADRLTGALGLPIGPSYWHRAEALLSIRLVDEARRYAELAADEFDAAGFAVEMVQSLLIASQATLLAGDAPAAAALAERALIRLGPKGTQAWSELAKVAWVRAQLAGGRADLALLRSATAAARRLHRAGVPTAALDATILAARVAVTVGRPAAAARLLATCTDAARSPIAEIRVQALLADALLRVAIDDRPGALRVAAAGLRALDHSRAALQASEVRARTASIGAELSGLGLRIALGDGEGRRILVWSERSRGVSLVPASTRPPGDPVLAELLAELREATGAHETAALDGSTAAQVNAAARRRAQLEGAIRRQSWQSVSTDPWRAIGPLRVADLSAALGERALVDFIEHDGAISAVVLGGGRAYRRSLGPMAPVAAALEALGFALRRVAARPPAADDAPTSIATLAAAARVDALLVAPLLPLIGDRSLVLLPSPSLTTTPWGLVPSISDRPLSIAPSAGLWLRAHGCRRHSGHILFASGPGLAAAATEVHRLAIDEENDATLLMGHHATAAAVLEGLNGARFAHLACHGTFRADNPLFTSLTLSDGPLTVYELERLDRQPRTVLLSACDTGRSSGPSGGAIMGLTASLIALGTTTIVASVSPVPDEATAALMVGLHRRLAIGTPVATALADARTELIAKRPDALATAAFCCFGAGGPL